MKWKLQLDSEMKIHEKCVICKKEYVYTKR